ncbi:MAG TPA: hypothetical protein PK413_06830 [Thermoanaerobaculia bacterium]|nr:hypothetical protein [Thermoanaerobaculia bacterium]
MRSWKKVVLALCGLVVAAATVAVVKIGPRNVIGMLRYDQRHEGTLRVGDRAPDVALRALDGERVLHLLDSVGPRPLVLVFGSFT